MTTAPRGNFVGSVSVVVPLCREHYQLTIRIPSFPLSRPGQFVQLLCRDRETESVDHEFDWSPDARPAVVGGEFKARVAFLRRPFSIAGRRDDESGVEIELIGREVGPGTRFLSQLQNDDPIAIIGPLGNTFELPPPGGTALLVGGGVGIPPMIYLAQTLADKFQAVAFAGATTADLLPLTVAGEGGNVWPKAQTPGAPVFEVMEFACCGVPVVLTTDDGSLGAKGYVTDALERYLDARHRDPANTVIYTCGPEPMMKRVQQIAEARGIRCQIAVERAMACGMGTCQSCCIRIKKPDPTAPPLAGKGWCYRLACTDGPVFSGDVLLW